MADDSKSKGESSKHSSYGTLSVGDYDDTEDGDSDDSEEDSFDETLESEVYQNAENLPVSEKKVEIYFTKRPKGWGKRHILMILGSWGFITAYAMRFNMSLAIVTMVKSTEADKTPNHNSTEVCHYPGEEMNETKKESEGEFDWDEKTQGLILAAFFWGYILTQIPSGILSAIVGGKWPMGLGVAVSGIMTLLTPWAARSNIAVLMFCRFIEGLAQGFIFPAMHQLLAYWAPPYERSFLAALAYSGAQFGAALSMVTSGYLITAYGWESVFYFTAVLTFVWFTVWSVLAYNSPMEHPTISQDEKNYIVKSIGNHELDSVKHIPWKAILTSRPVWVIAFAELCHTWGFYTLLMELPSYLKFVLSYHIEQNSWLSAAPDILMWAVAIFTTVIADKIISGKVGRTQTVRKSCHVIAECGAGLCLVGAAFVGCNRTGAVVLLTLAIGICGSVSGSYVPNEVEIACNYAGIIMGIANTVGNFGGLVVTIVTGLIIEGHATDQHRWRLVFFIAAGIYFLSAIIYVGFGTTKEQSWNRRGSLNADTDNNDMTTSNDTIVKKPVKIDSNQITPAAIDVNAQP